MSFPDIPFKVFFSSLPVIMSSPDVPVIFSIFIRVSVAVVTPPLTTVTVAVDVDKSTIILSFESVNLSL